MGEIKNTTRLKKLDTFHKTKILLKALKKYPLWFSLKWKKQNSFAKALKLSWKDLNDNLNKSIELELKNNKYYHEWKKNTNISQMNHLDQLDDFIDFCKKKINSLIISYEISKSTYLSFTKNINNWSKLGSPNQLLLVDEEWVLDV